MSAPQTAGAWKPDPWGKAHLRWHDGSDWTEHVHGEARAPTVAEQPAPHLAAVTRPTLEAPPELPSTPGDHPNEPSGTSGKAIAALIVGLVGVPVVGIVLGVLARRDIAASGERLKGRALAMAGIVLGALSTLWWAGLVLIFGAVLFGSGGLIEETRNRALSTEARANAKQLVNAIETCAATRSDGATSPCLDAGAIAEHDAAAAALLASCGKPGGACVRPGDGPMAYEVSATSARGTTFTERHGNDGTITKTCTTSAECETGTW